MAALGYPLASSGLDKTHYDHVVYATWYASFTGLWYCIGQDNTASDNLIWVKDQATPGTPGDGGGWSKCQLEGGSSTAYIDTRDTAIPETYWDDTNRFLYEYAAHSSPIFQKYYLENDGKWTRTIGNASSTQALPGDLASDSGGTRGQLVVDSNQRPWIVAYSSLDSKLYAFYRDDLGIWTTALTAIVLEGTAPNSMADSRVSVVPWTSAGSPGLMAVYTYSTNGATSTGDVYAAYRLDSAALTDAWTRETIATGISIDDHMSVLAYLEGAETTKRVHAMHKTGGANLHHWWRDAAGTWTDAGQVISTRSRPCLVRDASNNVLYCFHTQTANQVSPGGAYHSTPLPTISWSGETLCIQVDGVTENMEEPVACNHEVTYLTDLIVVCPQQATASWWNIVDILIPLPATPTLSSPADAALNQAVSLTLSWNAATYASTYDLQVATDAGFANLVVNQTGIAATSYAVSGLSNGLTYYWKVRGVNATGNGSYSTARTFTTVLLSASKRRRVMMGVG